MVWIPIVVTTPDLRVGDRLRVPLLTAGLSGEIVGNVVERIEWQGDIANVFVGPAVDQWIFNVDRSLVWEVERMLPPGARDRVAKEIAAWL